MNAPDRATLRDWTYAASHMAVIALLCACGGFFIYVGVMQQRDKTPLCAPDTSPVKVKP